jgi:hypothetical protein
MHPPLIKILRRQEHKLINCNAAGTGFVYGWYTTYYHKDIYIVFNFLSGVQGRYT